LTAAEGRLHSGDEGRRAGKWRFNYLLRYYSKVLNHFAQNLHDARILIVIGYGFRDPKINEMFMSFLKEKNKTAFVIDIQEKLPKTRYHRHPRVVYLSGGVEGMDSRAVLKKAAESCRE